MVVIFQQFTTDFWIDLLPSMRLKEHVSHLKMAG